MEDYKQIDKIDVWPHLQAGKAVFAVILHSKRFNRGIYNLCNWDVERINALVNTDIGKNTIFFEEADK